MTAIINGIQYIGGQTAPNEFIIIKHLLWMVRKL